MKKKSIFLASGLAVVLIGLLACFERPKCIISSSLSGQALYDANREVLLSLSSDGTARYWIEGEEETAGCNWHLDHLECRKDGCFFRCRETEALWRIALSGGVVEMEKVATGTMFPQKYEFKTKR